MSNSQRNILPDIVHFHSQFYRPEDIKPNDDFQFVTPMGAFRIAYSRRTGAQALFYARHVDDLAGQHVTDEHDEVFKYRTKIKYPERLALIEIKNRRHRANAMLASSDGRLQLDCSSILKRIYDAVQYIPRIQLREAVLHRLSGSYLSAHLGYYLTDVDRKGLSEISITTRIHTDYGFHKMTPGRMKKMAGRIKALRYLQELSPSLKLVLAVRQNSGEDTKIDQFPPSQIVPAILADAQKRIDAVYGGNDPAVFEKRQIIAVSRMFEAASLEVNSIRDELTSSRSVVRELAHWGLALREIPFAVLELAVDKIFADPPVSEYIPKNWQYIIHERRHMMPVISEMNKFMMQPKDEVAEEFEWLDPRKHRPTFIENRQLKSGNREEDFRYYIISNFLAPYCATMDYYGAFDDFSRMNNMAEVRLIREEVNNGLQLFYGVASQNLYAYFSSENFHPLKRLLPRDADVFFKEDKVLVCNLADFGTPMRTIPYRQFEVEMTQLGYTPIQIRLKQPCRPTADMMNIEPNGAAPKTPPPAPHA